MFGVRSIPNTEHLREGCVSTRRSSPAGRVARGDALSGVRGTSTAYRRERGPYRDPPAGRVPPPPLVEWPEGRGPYRDPPLAKKDLDPAGRVACEERARRIEGDEGRIETPIPPAFTPSPHRVGAECCYIFVASPHDDVPGPTRRRRGAGGRGRESRGRHCAGHRRHHVEVSLGPAPLRARRARGRRLATARHDPSAQSVVAGRVIGRPVVQATSVPPRSQPARHPASLL